MTCSNTVCQNGGTCTNLNVSPDSLIGYKCTCLTGYSGDNCEIGVLKLFLSLIFNEYLI